MSRLHNKKKLKSYRKSLRNHSTSAEAFLWSMLSNKKVNGLKFRRQHSVGPFIIDFYCPELKLGLELDGADHITYTGEDKDSRRDAFLNAEGIQVIHFENRFLFDNPGDIIVTILDFQKRMS